MTQCHTCTRHSHMCTHVRTHTRDTRVCTHSARVHPQCTQTRPHTRTPLLRRRQASASGSLDLKAAPRGRGAGSEAPASQGFYRPGGGPDALAARPAPWPGPGPSLCASAAPLPGGRTPGTGRRSGTCQVPTLPSWCRPARQLSGGVTAEGGPCPLQPWPGPHEGVTLPAAALAWSPGAPGTKKGAVRTRAGAHPRSDSELCEGGGRFTSPFSPQGGGWPGPCCPPASPGPALLFLGSAPGTPSSSRPPLTPPRRPLRPFPGVAAPRRTEGVARSQRPGLEHSLARAVPRR